MAAQPHIWMNGVINKDVFFNGATVENAYLNGVHVYTKTLFLTLNQQTAAFNLTNWIKSKNPHGRKRVIITNGLVQPRMDTGNLMGHNAATGKTELMDVTFTNNGQFHGVSASGTGMNVQAPLIFINNGWIRGAGGNGGKGGNGAAGAKGANDTYLYTEEKFKFPFSPSVPVGKHYIFWRENAGGFEPTLSWYTMCCTGPIGTPACGFIPLAYGEMGPVTGHGLPSGWKYYRGKGNGGHKYTDCWGHADAGWYYVKRTQKRPRTGGKGGSGGAGGAGGLGQWFNHSRTAGVNGKGGGAGHGSSPSGGHSGKKGGSGGKGGTGGTWGAKGASGAHGAGGGAAGKATTGWSKVKTGSKVGNMSGSRT